MGRWEVIWKVLRDEESQGKEMTMARAKASEERIVARYDDEREYQAERERTALADLVSLQIVKYRADHGLSQRQLGDLLGMPQANIARLEHGSREPSFATLDRISRTLGIEFQIVFTRQGPRAQVP